MKAFARFLGAVVTLVIICLSWYGAEMLLYGYSQPSIVDAFVAVCIALSISAKAEKERITDERKREFFAGILKGIQEGAEKTENGSDS